MEQLNKVENCFFLFGAVLMVIGSGANIFMQDWAPWVFAAGALAFVLMQLKQRYAGNNPTIKRLRKMIILSDVLFLLSAFLMFANMSNFLGLNIMIYVQYVHNNWVITLLIASLLQLYATHRISSELAKEL